MTEVSFGWCPSCRQRTVVDPGRPCVWCNTIVVPHRGGWTRPDLVGRITEGKARAIHAKYQTGVSARTLGRELYQVLGYRSARSCEVQIGAAFRRFGLPVRDRIHATVLASTSSGLSPRDHVERARRRKAAGLVSNGRLRPLRPRCEAVKSRPPGKGDRCSRPAMVGSVFCQSHDPTSRAQVMAGLERTRAIRDGRGAAA